VSTPPPTANDATELGAIAADAGLRRVHVLAWRDLADVEAGGSEVHAATVLRLWAEAGIDVTMRTSYAQGAPPESRRHGYHVVRRAGRYMVFPRAVVAELAGRHGPRDGLVEIWNGVPWMSPVWAIGPKVTWLHHVHGPMWDLVLPPRLAKLGHALEHRVAPPLYRRTPVVTLSGSSRRELVDVLGLRPELVHVVPPGVDARFRPAADPEAARSAHPLVVAVGRLMPVKRFDALVEAVAGVRERHPCLELVVVGEGAERERLEDLVAARDAHDWVRLPGRVSDDELVALYRRAWVVASASVAEGWGMTLTEAAACATPAVVTDIGGHRDAVQHGRTGLLAPLGELGAALSLVLADGSLRRTLAEGALARARELTWGATAAGTLRVLADDARRRRR
jgi:glycosyltransferase involved in cell wall biosynthesis